MICSCDCICSKEKAIPQEIEEVKTMYDEINLTKNKYWLCGDCFNNENCFYSFIVANLDICTKHMDIKILTEADVVGLQKQTIKI